MDTNESNSVIVDKTPPKDDPMLMDVEITSEVLDVMKQAINAECENTTYLLRSHPRAKFICDSLGDKIFVIFKRFLEGEGLPEVGGATKEQMEKSFSSFWSTRAKKQGIIERGRE